MLKDCHYLCQENKNKPLKFGTILRISPPHTKFKNLFENLKIGKSIWVEKEVHANWKNINSWGIASSNTPIIWVAVKNVMEPKSIYDEKKL